MRLLVSGATSTIREFTHGYPWLGHLLTPRGGHDPSSLFLPWAADNDAFSGFDPHAFCAMLDRIGESEANPMWVAAPDVVGNADGTLSRFEIWEWRIHERGLPVAFVAQDGLEKMMRRIPWDRFECLFIGGSTEWKLGEAAAGLMAEAKGREKMVHMGRVNSIERLEYAMRCGADTADGSGFSMFPATHIPWAVSTIAGQMAQLELF